MLVYVDIGPEPSRLPPFSSRSCCSRSRASQTGSGAGTASRQHSRTNQPSSETFHNISAFPRLFCKFCPALVFVRTWSCLPSTGDLGVMLHLPIIFQSPQKTFNTPHGLRAILVYVEIGAEHSRLPTIPSLAPAALGLCSGWSCAPVGGQVIDKTG
jgi:hypothetical protein